METLVLENQHKIVVPIFGAAYYTDLGLQKIVEFKDFSRLLSDFPVLFKADLIFNDFSRKPTKFKHFSSLCEPCAWNSCEIEGSLVWASSKGTALFPWARHFIYCLVRVKPRKLPNMTENCWMRLKAPTRTNIMIFLIDLLPYWCHLMIPLQTVRTQIRPNKISGQIRIQTVTLMVFLYLFFFKSADIKKDKMRSGWGISVSNFGPVFIIYCYSLANLKSFTML